MRIVLEHEIYVPTVAQLNDPADARPLLAPMSDEQLVNFLLVKNFDPNSSLAEQRRRIALVESEIQQHGDDRRREMSEMVNKLQEEDYGVYSMSKRFDNMRMWSNYAKEHSGYCLEFTRSGDFFAKAIEVTYGETIPMSVFDPSAYYFYCKTEDWRGEEEARVVALRGGKYVRIEPSWLTRIILGMKISLEHEQQIRGWQDNARRSLLW